MGASDSAITANLTFAEQGVAAWVDSRNSLVARRSEFVSKSGLFRERVFQYLGQQNTRHVNGQLTLQHETVLVGKYGDWLAEYTARIDRCRDVLLKRQSELRTLMKQISQLADNAKTNQAANNAEAAPAPYIAVAESKSSEAEMQQTCGSIVPPFDDFLVPRQDVAASLLLFGQALRWLLLTESRALALIVGLLGFGFFGALAASFIRDARAGRTLGSADIVVPAMIRGVAAAVLIFLATFGGVAVFSRAEPEPNAYAVFFACFIAAVFSEDVWAWAQRRQTAELGKTGGNAAGGADRGASGADIPRPNNPAEAITPARGPSDPPRDR